MHRIDEPIMVYVRPRVTVGKIGFLCLARCSCRVGKVYNSCAERASGLAQSALSLGGTKVEVSVAIPSRLQEEGDA